MQYFFINNQFYTGIYKPKLKKFKILTPDSNLQPDILLGDLANHPNFGIYLKITIETFSTFSFMVNPDQSIWSNDVQRYMLAKALLEAKGIIKTPRLLDSMDVIPKGMLGYDVLHNGFSNLNITLDQVDPSLIKKKKIVIASLNPIYKFNELAEVLQKKYGIRAENKFVTPPDYLDKMKSLTNVDVYCIGWASIFAHPDATFLPFYKLGLDHFTSLERPVKDIENSPTISEQFKHYRDLSLRLVSEGFIIPHSQVNSEFYVKPGITTSRQRFRYTLQISEISRDNQ